MKRPTLLTSFALGALSLSLAIGSVPAASAAQVAACPPTASDQVEFFTPAQGEVWDREELSEHWEWFGEGVLPGLAAEGLAGVSVLDPSPQRLTEFFTTGAQRAFDDYRSSLEALADRIELAGGQTAEHIRDFNAARYEYILAITNGFTDAYNADRVYDQFGQPDWENATEQFFYVTGRMIYAFEPNVGVSFLQHANWYPVSQTEIQGALQEISDEWALSGLSAADAEASSRSTMVGAVEEWVERQTLSGLSAFQVGATNNFDLATGLGYVVELGDTNDAVLATASNRESTRPLELRDLAHSVPTRLFVDQEILAANLNSSGTGFLSPEEASESTYVRGTVAEILEPLESSDDLSSEEFAAAVQEVVSNQLSRAHWLADVFDQTPLEFPHLLEDYSEDYLFSFAELENTELKRVFDWRDSSGSLGHDVIRAEQFAEIPFTLLREHGTTTIERTIRYSSVDAAALSGAETVTQSVDFCSTLHLLWGDTDWSDTSLTLPTVPTPPAVHPAPNATLGTPDHTVEAVTVTPTTGEIPVTDVVFPVDFTIAVRHVDEMGAALPAAVTAGSEQLTGAWGATATVSALTHDDWTLASGSATEEIRFDADQPEVIFTYRSVAAPTEPDTGTETDPAGPLVDTGAAGSGWGALLGTGLLVTGAAVVAWRVRRQNA
ncbi:hypothetical protein ACI1US_02575 [Leucobacter sp. BZR 635]